MASIIKACEIAPAAFSSKSHIIKENDLEYDLGNLMACDIHPFTFTNEAALTSSVRENVQCLMNAIFDCKQSTSEVGLIATLPPPVLKMPREKPCPKPHVETRWEKFAKEKGITKKKKTRMAFDEEKQEYAPAWGYKRTDDLSDWAIEVKHGQDPMADPWTARKDAKKDRVDKNTRQNLRNKEGAVSKIPSGIPVELTQGTLKGKEGTKKTLEKVQFATASNGVFDKTLKDEPVRKQKGKRTIRTAVVGREEAEREQSLSVMERLLGKEDVSGKRPRKDGDEDEEGKKKNKKLKKIPRKKRY